MLSLPSNQGDGMHIYIKILLHANGTRRINMGTFLTQPKPCPGIIPYVARQLSANSAMGVILQSED